MKKKMLGGLMEKIIGLPLEFLGALYDLVEKLAGEAGQQWLAELKKFLRKENCWTKVSKEAFLRIVSVGEFFIIDAVDGREILADATDVFARIDSDFKKWNADEIGQPTSETAVDVYEMKKDATFSQMFGSLSADVGKLCLTQAQIKNFCVKHRNWLREDGYATFFLFKSFGYFFVANVFFHGSDELWVSANRFRYGIVYHADSHHRMVLPKRA